MGNHERSLSYQWRAGIFLASFAISIYHGGCFKSVYAQDTETQSNAASNQSNIDDAILRDVSDALIPKDSIMFSNRGYVRSRVGDLSGALEDFDRAIAMDSKNIEAFSGRGYLRLYNGDGRAAISDFNQALAVDPKNAPALCGRGQARANMGAESEALADFNLAIQLDPTNAPSYIFRGYHLDRHGDQPRAIADYDQTIKLDPDNALAYCYRGTAREAVKDNKGAVADFTKVIKFDPQYAWAFYRRGQAREQLGDRAGAISDFNQYIKLKPTDPWGYRARGFSRQQQKDLKSAIRDYTKAIELEKTDPWTFSARGFLRGKTGDMRGSISDYQQAAKLERDKSAAGSSTKVRTQTNATTDNTAKQNASDDTKPTAVSTTNVQTTVTTDNTEKQNTSDDTKLAVVSTTNVQNTTTTDNTAKQSASDDTKPTAASTTNVQTSTTTANTNENSNSNNGSKQSTTGTAKEPTISLITDPAVYTLAAKTLTDAQKSFGPAIAKIKQILIFHRPGPHCQTMMWDADKGIFCVFMSNRTMDAYFRGNLGHELLHLLNAKLCDPYVEGLCSVFGEEELDSEAKRATYNSLLKSTPFYKETYLMMSEIKKSISPASYTSIFRYAKYDSAKRWMHIEIDDWINSLPPSEQQAVKTIIGKYADDVGAKTPKDGMYMFVRPAQK